jgi:hypothetical protein
MLHVKYMQRATSEELYTFLSEEYAKCQADVKHITSILPFYNGAGNLKNDKSPTETSEARNNVIPDINLVGVDGKQIRLKHFEDCCQKRRASNSGDEGTRSSKARIVDRT